MEIIETLTLILFGNKDKPSIFSRIKTTMNFIYKFFLNQWHLQIITGKLVNSIANVHWSEACSSEWTVAKICVEGIGNIGERLRAPTPFWINPNSFSYISSTWKTNGKKFIYQFLVVYKETSIYNFSLYFIYVNKIWFIATKTSNYRETFLTVGLHIL